MLQPRLVASVRECVLNTANGRARWMMFSQALASTGIDASRPTGLYEAGSVGEMDKRAVKARIMNH
jgi:hypothetical protein